MAKVRFEIAGDMPDGYAEIVLGVLLMSGLLRSQKLSKRKNPDGTYTVIVDVTGGLPPLGSMGLEDIPDERD
jgi:hypothetical protein